MNRTHLRRIGLVTLVAIAALAVGTLAISLGPLRGTSASALLTPTPTPSPFPTPISRPVCDGHRATIVGTDGDDTIFGTAGGDVIAGLRGRDIIDALGGDDVVCAGPGGFH